MMPSENKFRMKTIKNLLNKIFRPKKKQDPGKLTRAVMFFGGVQE